MLPPIAILIPYYTFFRSLGLIGNQGGLILTYLTGITPLLAWILMGYFATLPADIERAARIDGCSRLGVLRHVMIPMAMPGISACFIIAFLFCWNELLFGIILTGGSNAQTLSPALQTVSQNIGSLRGGEHALDRPAAAPGPRLSTLHHAPQHRRPNRDA